MKKSFADKCSFWLSNQMFLIVGLDIKPQHIPEDFEPGLKEDQAGRELRHTQWICRLVRLTAPHCSGWKPNLKFYEGSTGRLRLELVCKFIKEHYPDHILIGDNKDGDIGNTNKEAVDYYVNSLQLDAFTMNPLMGYEEGCDVYLSNPDIGVFTLCLTSNKGAKDFLKGDIQDTETDLELYQAIASNCASLKWNKNENHHLVVGATNTAGEIERVREETGEQTIFLMPGFGAQGGDYISAIKAGRNAEGNGFLGVVARDIINPNLNDGENIEQAIVRQAEFWNKAFAEAAAS